MGFFDLFNKKKEPVRVSFSEHEYTAKEMESQAKKQRDQKLKNFQKSPEGLYPHEILMLSYAEGYIGGKTVPRFWSREYAVDDVFALISSLEKRGFISGGALTQAGKDAVRNNEHVMYVHRSKPTDISMSDLCVLVNKNRNIPYRDLIWGEWNRLSLLYMQDRRYGLYRNIRYGMYKFLLEEKKYPDAFCMLSEVFLYDLNGSDAPFVAPGICKDLKAMEQKLDFSEDEIASILNERFDDIFVPYQNYTKQEIISMIAAYCFGCDEAAQIILDKGSG